MLCAESGALVTKWIDVCIGVIYSPKGGGMFGCSLRDQLLKEVNGAPGTLAASCARVVCSSLRTVVQA